MFLRHSGCTFCRETLADLREQLDRIRDRGFEAVIVHMSHPMKATQLLERYDLGTAHRISDPHQQLYRAFGIGRGNFGQLFGKAVWLRAARALFWDRHGLGLLDGDGFQMPAAFVVYRSHVLASFFAKHAADRIRLQSLLDDATRKAIAAHSVATGEQTSSATQTVRSAIA